MSAARRPSMEQIRTWLNEVCDPEIPVLSVLDLGVVRDFYWRDDVLAVVITPTYSGCPATQVMTQDIEQALRRHGIEKVAVETRLAPPWSSDDLSANGRRRLREYGIAPPERRVCASRAHGPGPESNFAITCPRCDSTDSELISQFGSTPCKALYRCLQCLEPFDYFKCF